ncbi:nuclear transport factor 2 family protein [Oligoflexia bacterium]|nr:nuclear transport factor 2 family protein [Oligoflexia bacterium]
MEEHYQAYLDYYRNLRSDNVSALKDIATEDLHFRDPFNEVKSCDAVIKIMSDMFRRLKEPRFVITDSAHNANGMYICWDLYFKTWLIKFGKEHAIQGMSYIEADATGKICKHIDYWDATTELYVHLPLIGYLFRFWRWLLR